MVSVCSVPNCPSQGTGCTMHAFPKSPELSRLWVTTIRRNDLLKRPAKILRRNRRVCDMHFSKSQRFPKNRKNTDLKIRSVPDMHLYLPKGFLQYSSYQLTAQRKMLDACARKTAQFASAIPVEALSKEGVLHVEPKQSLAESSVTATDLRLETAICSSSAPWRCTLPDDTSLEDKSSKLDEIIHSPRKQESGQSHDANEKKDNSVCIKEEWNEEDNFKSVDPVNVAGTNRNIDSAEWKPSGSINKDSDGINVKIKQEPDVVSEETQVKIEVPSEAGMQNWKALPYVAERKNNKHPGGSGVTKSMEFLENCPAPSTPSLHLADRKTVRAASRKKAKGAAIKELLMRELTRHHPLRYAPAVEAKLSSTELLCLSVAKEVMKMPVEAQKRFKVDMRKLCIKYYGGKMGSSRG